MGKSILTNDELDLFKKLPGPPEVGAIQTTTVWIVEWLFQDDQKTGKFLHEWLQERRPGWSWYSRCQNKMEVLAAINRATELAQRSEMKPILHIEAHGNDDGVGGPDGAGGSGLITWDELTNPLQGLNLATRCNLIVFVAACTGFAAINTFTRGPLAPAVGLVGPDNELSHTDVLSATKEFYRRWMNDEHPKLDDFVASASRETEPVTIALESFALLAFEALTQSLIIAMRPSELRQRIDRIRRSVESVDGPNTNRATLRSIFAHELQKKWDRLFMIDLYSENRKRFGLDVDTIIQMIFTYQGVNEQ